MKRFLIGSLTSVLLFCNATSVAQAIEKPKSAENAQVTLTVVKFRSIKSGTDRGYVDAVMTLAGHPDVTQVDRAGLPPLVVKRAVDLEISVVSADRSESYTPLAVYFEQQVKGGAVKQDRSGKINITQWQTNKDTVVIRNKFVHQGSDGEFEFFVVVQRASDGEIGIIDPMMTNEVND